jgi:hypothetical protein
VHRFCWNQTILTDVVGILISEDFKSYNFTRVIIITWYRRRRLRFASKHLCTWRENTMHHKDLAARQHQFIVLGLMDTNEHKHTVPLWSPKNFSLYTFRRLAIALCLAAFCATSKISLAIRKVKNWWKVVPINDALAMLWLRLMDSKLQWLWATPRN